MRAAAEDGDAAAFQRADREPGVVTRDAGLRKAGQVGIGDRRALDGACQRAEAGPEDQAELDGLGSGARARDVCGFGHVSVP